MSAPHTTAKRFGLHTSTAGALDHAAREAIAVGADTFQIFSASPRMWHGSLPDAAGVKALRDLRDKHDLHPLVIHGNYLINLASLDAEIRRKSIHAFRAEIARALLIGADYLVFHPGSFKNQSVEEALLAVRDGLQEAAKGLQGGLRLLIENTAGQGSALGSKLEELAELKRLVDCPLPIGYCIDTCHSFAAGYDLGSVAFIETVSTVLGWDNVPVIHANDSQGARGSRLDRHAHIGRGQIGEADFRAFLQRPELDGKAFILETPEDDDCDDRGNLAALRRLAGVTPPGSPAASAR
jgi:deoxyribonuclease IV